MRSLRTRITFMTVCVLFIVVTLFTLLTVAFIRKTEHRKSDQLLFLMCQTGERNLNYYFNSVQQSVEKVASFVEADLNGTDDGQLEQHMERVGKYFDEMAAKTNGVLTYYYRTDPAVSDTVKGFWYTNIDGKGFTEHEVTDITLYDTKDTSKLVWFTVPKYQGESIWLPPYITDNLDKRVISYNVPIYREEEFIGVVGIEIDYSTMAEQVDSIKLFDNGYAFLSDEEGNLFYHPRIDVTQLTDDTRPMVPEGAVDENTFIRYSFEGVEKEAAWLALSNGMRLNVTVPVSEMEGEWRRLIKYTIILALEVLVAASIFTMYYTRHITKPLEELTAAAEQVDKGNFDYILDYDKDDEVGRLTNTFKHLSSHMRDHISDLNKQVYTDALTQVKNKGAFSTYIDEIQRQMDKDLEELEFAVGMFDCDDLKIVNDQYGHEKGDLYLKKACHLICCVFPRSPVFRIGGDEFSVILRYEDYMNMDILIKQFEMTAAEITASTENIWEQVRISMGIAVYDPKTDHSVQDVVRRADEIMYENKRVRKKEEM